MRLRLGLLHQDLAYRFKTNTRQVSTVILTWIQLLYKQFGTIWNLMFSTRDKVRQHLPSVLKSTRTSTALLTTQKFMYDHQAILRHKEINILHIKGIPHISFWLFCLSMHQTVFILFNLGTLCQDGTSYI